MLDEPADDELRYAATGTFARRRTPSIDEDPFQDLPYDDSRRLPASHAFDDGADDHARRAVAPLTLAHGGLGAAGLSAVGHRQGTGRPRWRAVTLALVTKKVGEFFPSRQKCRPCGLPRLTHAAETGCFSRRFVCSFCFLGCVQPTPSLYDALRTRQQHGRKALAVLLDPDNLRRNQPVAPARA